MDTQTAPTAGAQWADLPDVLTEPEVAGVLRWSEQHLRARRAKLLADPSSDAAPPFVKLGRRTLRYNKADVIAWLDRQRDLTLGTSTGDGDGEGSTDGAE